MALSCTQASHAASEIFPGDFESLKPGTQVLSLYYYNRELSGFYVDSKAIGDAEVQAHAFVASYSYYFSMADMTSAVSIVQPYIYAKRTDGVLPDGFGERTNGLGNVYIMNKIWPIDTPTHSLVIANTFYFVSGEYSSRQGLNAGENRWRDTLQLAWLQSLNEQLRLELIPEVMFYGTNNNFIGSKMKQEPTYSLTSYLRWILSPTVETQIGAQYNFGGEQSFDGVDQNNQPNNHRWMLGISRSFSNNTFLALRYTKDFSIKSDMKIDADYVLSLNYLF